jgi:hypothetical protein
LAGLVENHTALRRRHHNRQFQRHRSRVDHRGEAHGVVNLILGQSAFDHDRFVRTDAHLATVDSTDGKDVKGAFRAF